MYPTVKKGDKKELRNTFAKTTMYPERFSMDKYSNRGDGQTLEDYPSLPLMSNNGGLGSEHGPVSVEILYNSVTSLLDFDLEPSETIGSFY